MAAFPCLFLWEDLDFKAQDFKMLRRYKLCFAAVVLAVTIFLVFFSHDSLRHVQSYNSGAIRNGVSAVIEMKKINSYKPSLLGKTSTEIIRWIHLTFLCFCDRIYG